MIIVIYCTLLAPSTSVARKRCSSQVSSTCVTMTSARIWRQCRALGWHDHFPREVCRSPSLTMRGSVSHGEGLTPTALAPSRKHFHCWCQMSRRACSRRERDCPRCRVLLLLWIRTQNSIDVESSAKDEDLHQTLRLRGSIVHITVLLLLAFMTILLFQFRWTGTALLCGFCDAGKVCALALRWFWRSRVGCLPNVSSLLTV